MATMNQKYEALETITVGMTKVVFGHVVTRWTEDLYEIDTVGNEVVDIHCAVDHLN